jgi:two-component system LytT family sensor kinase
MRKLLFVWVLLLLFSYASKAQSVTKFKDSFYYASNSKELGFNLSIKVDDSTKRVEYHNLIPNQPLNNLVYLEGAKTLALFVSVKDNKLSSYRYSVYENDSIELVSNAIPKASGSSTTTFGISEHASGTFNIENKKLTITYYKISNPNKVASVIIFNKRLLPARIRLITLETIFKNGVGVEMSNYKDSSSLKINDKTKSLFVAIDNTEMDFLYTLSLKNKSTGKIVFTSRTWDYDFLTPRVPHMLISATHFKNNEVYEISIKPTLLWPYRVKPLPVRPAVYSFKIIYSENTFSKTQLVLFGLIGTVFLSAVFLGILIFIKRKEGNKLAVEFKQKEVAKLQLNTIRSQLNPHFLFNALAGIQNLMNKNDVDSANRYLTKFARLTRNVLDAKELISLSEEKTLLDDYLQMEQLRFGFKYEIYTSADLELDNIEIPSMLLQPFLENAVKHGIAEKGNEGEIKVEFRKQGSDLILSVLDNGKGFQENQQYPGIGLSLSKNRIALLNTLYKENAILYSIQSDINGTKILITLTQWL